MKPITPQILTFLTALLFTSCGKDQRTSISIENPMTYEFLRDGHSTVSFLGQTTRIAMATELVSAMTDLGVGNEKLIEMYTNESVNGGDVNPFSEASLNESTKSIKSKVAGSTDYFSSNTTEGVTIKADIESWITNQVTEVFSNENVLAKAGVSGQIADGSKVRYINAKGLEYDQAVAKSLIGALMVDQICNNYLSVAVLDASQNQQDNTEGITGDNVYTAMEHKWDEAYGYLFGESSDASDPLATLGEGRFLDKYLSTVNDDPDFSGIASDIFEAFKLGRAAIVAGDYKVRDEQATILRKKISEVIAVRAIYYLQSGKRALEARDMGGAFHDLSEGFGFVYSLRFTREDGVSYFSRSDVDGFQGQLMNGNGFWDLESSTLDSISEDIATKFDFTVAQAGE